MKAKRRRSWRVLLAVMALGLAVVSALPGARLAKASDLLTASGVTGVYVLYRLDPSWAQAAPELQDKVVAATKTILTADPEQVLVEGYLTRGMTAGSDFMLRIHAREPALAQETINALAKSAFGRFLKERATFTGVTKETVYIDKNPDLYRKLKAGKYEDSPPKYALMVPVKKTAEWWNLPFDERMEMIENHTIASLDFLSTVNRKLYHATGLSDYDFLTFFTCARLEQFSALMVQLRSIPESKYTTYGHPIVLGTIHTFEDLFDALK